MSRKEIETALASAVEKQHLGWGPTREIASIAFRRWTTFSRRSKSKQPTREQRINDLAKGLQAHFEPDFSFTPLSEWWALAESLAMVFEQYKY